MFGETWILKRNAGTFLRLMVLVKNQVPPLAEDFPTFMTSIGFLDCMAFQMHIEGGNTREDFATLSALMGLLCGMHVLMLCEVLFQAKGTPTFITFVRFLYGMHLVMLKEIRVSLKAFQHCSHIQACSNENFLVSLNV